MLRPLVTGLLLAALGSAQAGPADTDVVRFHASVRVDVGADGKPTLIEVPEDFPAAVRDFIGKRVSSWQYQPATRDGVPQAATTYVRVDACAVPAEGGFRLAVDFGGNGMRVQGDKPMPPPIYPREAMGLGVEAKFDVIMNIDGQGNASIDRLENESIHRGRERANGQMRQKFVIALQHWVKTLHFDPERVGGQPVAMTQARIPVEFTMAGGTSEWRDALQAQARASSECQAAASGRSAMEPIALHPAVTVNPRPAGEG